jgi:predicted ATP-dependent serine protease
VAEAARLGYRRIMVPPGSAERIGPLPPGVRAVEVAHVERALRALRDLTGRD